MWRGSNSCGRKEIFGSSEKYKVMVFGEPYSYVMLPDSPRQLRQTSWNKSYKRCSFRIVVGKVVWLVYRVSQFWKWFLYEVKFHSNGLNYSPFVHRKSFPSGHSSFSFAVFTFSFLYLAGKARSFTGGNGGRKIPSVLFLLYLGLILGWFNSTLRRQYSVQSVKELCRSSDHDRNITDVRLPPPLAGHRGREPTRRGPRLRRVSRLLSTHHLRLLPRTECAAGPRFVYLVCILKFGSCQSNYQMVPHLSICGGDWQVPSDPQIFEDKIVPEKTPVWFFWNILKNLSFFHYRTKSCY